MKPGVWNIRIKFPLLWMMEKRQLNCIRNKKTLFYYVEFFILPITPSVPPDVADICVAFSCVSNSVLLVGKFVLRVQISLTSSCDTATVTFV